MSVLDSILEEEYERSVRMCHHIRKELERLPKGSVRIKKINGREYYYRTFREGNKVRSAYIPASEVDAVRAQIERRRELQSALREHQRSQKQIERALGVKH
ncbi:hypothetical protein [Collinsella provencensis]|uniref:hypothetical protein n=1 Tax=Collinsella provencensis TaxID=1937461 RepID=UPI000C853CE1|nr:hypothetical protein [Collinsella provencensis]